MNHADLIAACLEEAGTFRLDAYHFPDSVRVSARGFPDLVIVGQRGVLWREAKTGTGRLTPEQRRLGYLLQACRQNWAVWRPADLASGRVRQELGGLCLVRAYLPSRLD